MQLSVVLLCGDNSGPLNILTFVRQIGRITHTDDPAPSFLKAMDFPSGFKHDLFLINKGSWTQTLPRIISPAGAPRVTGWGPYKDVLDGHPVFMIAMHRVTGNRNDRAGGNRYIPSCTGNTD